MASSLSATAESLPLKRSLLRCLLLGLLGLVLFSTCLKLFWPQMTAVTFSTGRAEPISLPWVFHRTARNQHLQINLHANWLTPNRWQIIPDDRLRSLTVNDIAVSLKDIPAKGLEDYTNGFVIDLSEYLHTGDNTLEFVLDNRGGDGGLSFRPMLSNLHWFFIGCSFLPWLLSLARIFRLRVSQTLILCISLMVLYSYWQATPWQTRTHDVMANGGHLDYIVYVAQHLSLPVPTEGWTYYHPPLYYTLGAAIYRWAEFWNLPAPETLQGFSLALWLVFLTSSAGAMRRAISGRGALLSATLLLALWPVGIIHSIRIGNDIAAYATSGIATWFCVSWWQGRRRSDLIGMAIACALALLSKSNALALLGSCGSLLLIHCYRRRSARAVWDIAWFSAISGIGLALSFATRLYYYWHGQLQDWLVGNADGLNSGLSVPTTIKSFLPLDIPTFLTTPWMSAWDDEAGRNNFWNYLLRSSLSGEFTFSGGLQTVMAYLMGVCLLLLVFSAIASLRTTTKAHAWRYLPWSLLAFFWIASLLVLRIQLPYSCSNDFRYVLPVIVPALVIWSLSGRSSKWLMLIMASASAVFFIGL